MKQLFYPKSIAVIGASKNPEKIGHQILKNLIDNGFKGYLFPVNLDGENILGLKAYTSIEKIGAKIDLVIICIPRDFVLQEIKKIANKNIKNVIIISAGFKELDTQGKVFEKQIKKITEDFGINLVGPNSLGVYSVENHLNASFGKNYKHYGKASVISQSGAIITSFLDYAEPYSFGLNKIISLGNKTNLNENDFLEYLVNENKTQQFLLYIESFSDFEKTSQIISKNSDKKFYFLFSGSSKEGSAASASHTGNLSSDFAVAKTLIEKAGGIFLNNLEEFFNILITPEITKPNKIKIITNAGGPAISLIDIIQKHLPDVSIHLSDIRGDATEIEYEKEFLKTNSRDFDLVNIIVTPQTNTNYEKIFQKIIQFKKHYKKVIVVNFLSVNAYVKYFEKLSNEKIYSFFWPHKFFELASNIQVPQSKKLIKYRFRSKEIGKILKSTTNFHLKPFKIFEKLKMPVIKTELAENLAQVIKIANDLHYPVVLKTASEKVIHKASFNGIYLNIKNSEELKSAYLKLSRISKKVLLQPMHFGGEEVIIGAKKVKNTSVFLFGKGGSYVEKFKDVSNATSPLTYADIDSMLEKTVVGNLIEKDLKPVLVNIFGKLEWLINTNNISEIDLNPININPNSKELIILDARIL